MRDEPLTIKLDTVVEELQYLGRPRMAAFVKSVKGWGASEQREIAYLKDLCVKKDAAIEHLKSRLEKYEPPVVDDNPTGIRWTGD